MPGRRSERQEFHRRWKKESRGGAAACAAARAAAASFYLGDYERLPDGQPALLPHRCGRGPGWLAGWPGLLLGVGRLPPSERRRSPNPGAPTRIYPVCAARLRVAAGGETEQESLEYELQQLLPSFRVRGVADRFPRGGCQGRRVGGEEGGGGIVAVSLVKAALLLLGPDLACRLWLAPLVSQITGGGGGETG